MSRSPFQEGLFVRKQDRQECPVGARTPDTLKWMKTEMDARRYFSRTASFPEETSITS